MSYARRVDGNHGRIREALRKAGCNVCDAFRLGQGAPDLLVARSGRVWLMEVKTPTGKLTKAQRDFHGRFPVHVVMTIEDALRLVGCFGL